MLLPGLADGGRRLGAVGVVTLGAQRRHLAGDAAVGGGAGRATLLLAARRLLLVRVERLKDLVHFLARRRVTNLT